MVIDNTNQIEATLLAVIAQAEAGGASREDVEPYVRKLTMKSSKELVDNLFNNDPNASSLRKWARSL
jgi:hypothetical protein